MEAEGNKKAAKNSDEPKKRRSKLDPLTPRKTPGTARRKRSRFAKSLIGKVPGEVTPTFCRAGCVERKNPQIDHPIHTEDELREVEPDLLESAGFIERVVKSFDDSIDKVERNPAELPKFKKRFETVHRHSYGLGAKIKTWTKILRKCYHTDEVTNSYLVARLPPMTLNNLSALFPASAS
jgi:hypothetical protein